MMEMLALFPIRQNYTLNFDNFISLYSEDHPDYYWAWAEFMFETVQDAILSERYLIIVNHMQYHRDEYISSLVDEIYTETLCSVSEDVSESEEDAPGEYTSAHILYDYIYGYEDDIKRNMYNIAMGVIFNIAHPLHHFVLSAMSVGVTFSNFLLSPSNSGHSLTVTCTTSMEVIKKHNGNWYDRLSLLTTV